jgi:hypothetical protein
MASGTRKRGRRADETGIAEQPRKLLAQVDLDVSAVEPLERPIPRVLEEDENGEDLRWVQPGCPAALACAASQQLTLPLRLEALPKGGDGAKAVEYPHSDVSSVGCWVVRNRIITRLGASRLSEIHVGVRFKSSANCCHNCCQRTKAQRLKSA